LEAGRREITRRLSQSYRGLPLLLVSEAALWTMRGFAGGYTRSLVPKGPGLQPEAEAGPYRLLMEGIEAFCGSLTVDEEDEDMTANMAFDKHGRAYLSAMPQR
jgi:hypothetical protein